MRIAYLTTDDVNHDLARRTANDNGAILEVLAQGGPSPADTYDAVLVDWDYLPGDGRLAILAALVAGRWRCPVAVHGYHLEAQVQDTLSRKGVVIHRRLESFWLARWLRRVQRRAGGKAPAAVDLRRVPAHAKAKISGSSERRTSREEPMTTTQLEANWDGTRTPLTPPGDQGVVEVDWTNYQVALPRDAYPHPPLARAEYPAPEPAGHFARMVAVFLDTLLVLLPWAVGLFLLAETLDRPEYSILHVRWVQLGTLAVVLGQAVLLALRGQTFGKMAVGIRVVRARDGRNPGFWRAVILRALVPALVLWGCLPAEPVFYHVLLGQLVPPGVTVCLVVIGRILAVIEVLTFLKEDGPCLHDQLAGTRVVEV
jgi:uncharacterized RDD family membrane protein YckC